MSLDDAVERLAPDRDSQTRNRWIGVYIGVLAVLLAVCSMGGGNAAKEATRANIEASNTWAFFQAKNLRRHTIRLQSEEYELLLASQPGMPDIARAAIQAKIAGYRDLDKLLSSDAKQKEGLDELFERGKALERERDVAMRKDPYFDWGQALLQIAIVLASVSLITGGGLLIGMSGVVALVGAVMTLNGFTLAFTLPFIG